MPETTRKRPTKRFRRPDPTRPNALTAAALLPNSTVSAVMDQLPPETGAAAVTKAEKQILQGIAHGAEGFGNEYGSGPGSANEDAEIDTSSASPDDVEDEGITRR